MNNNIRNLVKEKYHNLINLNLKNTKTLTFRRQEVSVKKGVGGGGGEAATRDRAAEKGDDGQ